MNTSFLYSTLAVSPFLKNEEALHINSVIISGPAAEAGVPGAGLQSRFSPNYSFPVIACTQSATLMSLFKQCFPSL